MGLCVAVEVRKTYVLNAGIRKNVDRDEDKRKKSITSEYFQIFIPLFFNIEFYIFENVRR